MADVTTDSLKSVKSALSGFLTDIEGLSSRAESIATETTNACASQVKKSKNDVSQSILRGLR